MAESPTRTMRATRRRYQPSIELGQGATATVWRARDTRSGRDVALKRFHPHLLSDPVTRRRIKEEAAAASRVSHPNIVTAVDTIEDREGLALVFPYIAGETLAQRLERGPRLAPREAATIALDVADALAAAHSAGVVHRDVKPGNILLGTDDKARLLDFGIAHAAEASESSHEMTGAGMAIGTLPYMAPEQLAAESTTPASDVYALGAVLYEMLSGTRPYAAASPVALAKEQAQSPARIADAPDALVDMVLSAMTLDAAARPDAAQLARGLSAWRDGRSDADAATSRTTAAPIEPRPRRPALGWLAIGLAAAVLAIALPVAASGWLTAQPDRLNLIGGTVERGAVAAGPSPTSSPPSVLGASDATPDRSGGGSAHDKPGKADNPDKPDKGKGKPKGGKRHRH